MTRRRRCRGCLLVAGTALAAVAPASAASQLRPEQETGWRAVEIGVRVGYDNALREELVGGLLRIPILPNGSIELVPSADVTFLSGLKEYQLNAEAIYLWLSPDGGLYAGGGFGFRNTIPPESPEGAREYITTYSLVVGLKLTNLPRVNPMLEFRRVFASDLEVDPQHFVIGLTVELW